MVISTLRTLTGQIESWKILPDPFAVPPKQKGWSLYIHLDLGLLKNFKIQRKKIGTKRESQSEPSIYSRKTKKRDGLHSVVCHANQPHWTLRSYYEKVSCKWNIFQLWWNILSSKSFIDSLESATQVFLETRWPRHDTFDWNPWWASLWAPKQIFYLRGSGNDAFSKSLQSNKLTT